MILGSTINPAAHFIYNKEEIFIKRILLMVALVILALSGIAHGETFDRNGIMYILTVNDDSVFLAIANRIDAPITILWDESSIVDSFNVAHRVVKGDTKVMFSSSAQPPTVIPPGTNVTETMIPSGFISGSTIAPGFTLAKPDSNISVMITEVINEKKTYETFTLKIPQKKPQVKSTESITAPVTYKPAKKPWTAVGYSVFIPGTGEIYAGNWLKAALFGIPRWLIVFSNTGNEEMSTLQSLTFFGLTIWEAIDSYKETKKYNEKHPASETY